MKSMKVFVSPDEIESALRELGPIGDLGEATVKVATEAYLHLMRGGSVNGMRLVSIDGGDAMKLRKPCEHGRYEQHWYPETHRSTYPNCPGGVFLPDDTLIIEKVDGQWPAWALRAMYNVRGHAHNSPKALLDALSVREAE